MNLLNGIIKDMILGKTKVPAAYEIMSREVAGNDNFNLSDHKPYIVGVRFK